METVLTEVCVVLSILVFVVYFVFMVRDEWREYKKFMQEDEEHYRRAVDEIDFNRDQ